MKSNVIAFPAKPVSLDTLANDFVSRLVGMKPNPFGRYGAARLDDGTVIARYREPSGADETHWFSLSNEGRDLFVRNGRATTYRENEEFWREWLANRRAA